MTLDVMDQKEIVETNESIGFDKILVGWTDSNFRDLHLQFNPNVDRFHAVGDVLQRLAFCTHPARRAMTAHDPMIATSP
jgi:hypothetical protein